MINKVELTKQLKFKFINFYRIKVESPTNKQKSIVISSIHKYFASLNIFKFVVFL